MPRNQAEIVLESARTPDKMDLPMCETQDYLSAQIGNPSGDMPAEIGQVEGNAEAAWARAREIVTNESNEVPWAVSLR
jgi:hypothetical protein